MYSTLLSDALKCYILRLISIYLETFMTVFFVTLDRPGKAVDHAPSAYKLKFSGLQVSQFYTMTNSIAQTMFIYVTGNAYSGELRWRVVSNVY